MPIKFFIVKKLKKNEKLIKRIRIIMMSVVSQRDFRGKRDVGVKMLKKLKNRFEISSHFNFHIPIELYSVSVSLKTEK